MTSDVFSLSNRLTSICAPDDTRTSDGEEGKVGEVGEGDSRYPGATFWLGSLCGHLLPSALSVLQKLVHKAF